MPRLIVIKRTAGASPDIAGLKARLADVVPNAILDNHRLWIERLSTMSRWLFIVAVFILVLVLMSMMLAVNFATRGAMAGNREIIDVLHFVGAEDRYIARQFQRHFLTLGLQGGGVGGGAAIAVFVIAGKMLSSWSASPGGEQVASLFGTFSLSIAGYIAIAAISLGAAFLTALASRIAVVRRLTSLG